MPHRAYSNMRVIGGYPAYTPATNGTWQIGLVRDWCWLWNRPVNYRMRGG